MGAGQEAASIYAKIGADISGLQGGLDKAGGIIGGFAKTIGVSLVAAGAAIVGIGTGILALASNAAPLVGVQAAFEGISGAADKTIEALRKGSLGMVRDADLMKSYNTAAQLVSKTFADQLPDAMGYLSKVSAATGQDMGFMMESLVKGIGRMSPMILDNLGIQVNLVEANEAYAKSIGKSASELTKAEQQTALMNSVMEKLAANTAAMPEIAGSAAQGMASLGTTMANIKDKVGMALVPVLQAVLGPLSQLASEYGPQAIAWAQNFAGVLTATVVPGIQSLFGAFSEVTALLSGTGGDWSALEEQLGAVFGPDIAARVTGFISGLSGLGTAVAPAIAMFTGALSGIGPILGQIGVMIGGLVANVAPLFIQFVTQAAALVMTNLPLIQATVTNALTAIQIIWTAVWPVLSAVLTTAWNTMQVVVQTALNLISGLVKTALQLLQGDWSGAWETIKTTVTTVWAGIQTAITTALSGLAGIVTSFLPQVIQAGTDLLMGLATGIGNAVGGVIAKAQEVASGIVNAVKNALGVHSPSTIMQTAGADLMEGLIIGVGHKEPEVLGKLADVTQSILGLLGTDLNVKAPGAGWGAALDAWLEGAAIAGDKLIKGLQVAEKRFGVESMEKAAKIAGSVQSILGLLSVGLEVKAPAAGFAEGIVGYVAAMSSAMEVVVPALSAMSKRWGDGLTEAQATAASVAGVFDAINSIAQSVASAADIGGIDVGAARALIAQAQSLLNPGPGVVVPTIGDIGGGAIAGGAPDLSGVLTTLQNWNPKVQININVAVQGGASTGLNFSVGGMDQIAQDLYVQASLVGAIV